MSLFWFSPRRHKRRQKPRPPRFEPLEDRLLLSDTSAPPILQYFEGSYTTITQRVPDIFSGGYGAVLTPPPGRADSGNQSW
jgi:hypothetical protein